MCTLSILFADSSIALQGHTLGFSPPPLTAPSSHTSVLARSATGWQPSGSCTDRAVVSALMGDGPHQGFQG